MSFAKFDPWAALAEIRKVDPLSRLSQPCRSPVAAPATELPLPHQPLIAAVATVATVASPEAEKPEPGPARSWTAEDWREYYEERLAVAMIDGEQPEPAARAIAHECCIAMWLCRNPAPSDPSRCCHCHGCDSEGVLVPFGAAPGDGYIIAAGDPGMTGGASSGRYVTLVTPISASAAAGGCWRKLWRGMPVTRVVTSSLQLAKTR